MENRTCQKKNKVPYIGINLNEYIFYKIIIMVIGLKKIAKILSIIIYS